MTTAQADRRRDLAKYCQANPVWFVNRVLGRHLWSRQIEVVQSVRDHRRTAVRSGHGIGKTFTAAAIVLWFLYSFPDSRVVTTATKWSQVKRLLWHEIGLLHSGADVVLGGKLNLTELSLPDGRYAIGLSTRPGQEESFAGHHARYILLVFDEASGVPAAVYETGEGYMTTPGARVLLIGNPTRPEGEFYAAFHGRRDLYNLIHISALDSPAITGEKVPEDLLYKLTGNEWVDERRKMWGEGSPLWDVRVAGNFAKQADDAVIDLVAIEDAVAREVEPAAADPVCIGVDVARFGSDETVISERVGRRIRIVKTYQGRPLTETAGHAGNLYRKHRDRVEDDVEVRVVVDDPGVGGGVTDIMREQAVPVEAFNGGHTALEPEDYPNRRSESWFVGADKLPLMDLDDDDQLAADLAAPRYKVDSQGRRVVEPKEDTKKRLGRSPDRADSVLLTLAAKETLTMEVW